MKPATIRRIDAYVGVPVCWLLTGLRRILGLFRRPSTDPPKKILFLKLVELGANVQASVAVRRAAERVGRENLFFWVFDENRPILEILDLVPPQNILTVRAHGVVPLALDVLRTLWAIRRLKIDAVVDMEFFARASAILALLTGARLRVGLHRFNGAGPYRGDLMTHRIQHNPYTHVSAYFYLLVESLFGPPGEVPLPKRPVPDGPMQPASFCPSAAELARVEHLLDEACGGRVSRPIVVLNPNASDIVPLRKWPIERFVQVGRLLLAAHPDATVVVTGAAAERAGADEVISAIGSPRAVSLAGRTTLRDLLVLYCLADVLVTNDSGPAQFAAMTPLDAVVLFGPETPALWAPLGQRVRVLWAALACSPCINPLNFRFSPCTNPRCMEQISVEQVVEAVEAALARRAAAKIAA